MEDENYCEENVPCCPAGWFTVSVYPNGYENDFYKAYSGKRMIGFFVWTTEGVRTYWQTRLLCPLQQGKVYQLGFYLYSPISSFKVDHFGAYFSENKIASTTDTVLQFAKYLPVEKQYISADMKSGWLKIVLSFTATGKEKYLVLGNFDNPSLPENRTAVLRKYVKYFVDDISLVPLDKTILSCMEYQSLKDSLYKASIRHQFYNEHPLLLPVVPVVTTKTAHAPATDTLQLNNVNFTFDSYKLTNTCIITEYFNIIKKDDIENIEVLGYTDSIGSSAYNKQLSLERAEAVKNFLITKYSFNHSQVIATGRGISRKNRDVNLNRRVEIIINKNR